MCQTAINAAVTVEDVNEMLMQHILTEEIFTTVLTIPIIRKTISPVNCRSSRRPFHGADQTQTLDGIKPYYQMIKARAGKSPTMRKNRNS
jgi:predicted helicase